jgi:hypothetical protein
MNSPFYVVGNGPSLTVHMLRALPSGQWLGMNSAYKVWKQLGLYPKFYACLDPVVVASQGGGIEDLLATSPIEKYFLHDELAKERPHLREDKRIVWLSDFLEGAKRLPMSTFAKFKQTTGMLATRFAIEEGHDDIILVGVDCNYVEVIDGASKGPGNELTIVARPHRNPNYFFADYQSAGDRYQIPNPSVHSGNLHLQSFLPLAAEVRNKQPTLSISVGSTKSLLHRYGIFPLREFWHSLGRRRIQCIAIPITLRELDGLLENMLSWLSPKLRPSFFHDLKTCVVHVFFDGQRDQNAIDRLDRFLAENPAFFDCFSELRATFLDLPPKVNYYQRRQESDRGRFCTKSGPNVFFLATMAQCAEYDYTFQMESDCLPIRAGWLDAAEHEVTAAKSQEPWIVGPGYFSETRLHTSYRAHINGNAIYRTGCAEFQEFIRGDFQDLLKHLISEGVNDLAYDTMLSFAAWNAELLDPAIKRRLHHHVSRFHHSALVLNLGGRVENESQIPLDTNAILSDHPAAFFVHGRKISNAFMGPPETHPSYFDAHQDSTIRELPFGYFWSGSPSFKAGTYDGYGKGSLQIAGSDSSSIVVLHFRRTEAAPILGRTFAVSACFVNGVEFEVTPLSFSALTKSGPADLPLVVRKAESTAEGVQVLVTTSPCDTREPVDTVLLKIRIKCAIESTEITFRQLRCHELLPTPARDGRTVIVSSTAEARAIIQDWVRFIDGGERK